MRPLTILTTAIVLAALSVSPAWATQPLQSPADLTSLCATSAPLAGETAQAQTQYLVERRRHLLETYSAILGSDRFAIDTYDDASGVVRLVTEESLRTTVATLQTPAPPVLTFSMEPQLYEDLRARHVGGTLGLRLTFALESLWHPELAYCALSSGPRRPKIRVRLLRVELVDDGGTVLVAQDLSALTSLGRTYGLSLERPPQQALRVKVDDLRTVSGDAGTDEFSAMSTLAEQLAFPCFLGAVGRDGPSRAALVMEVDFDSNGRVRSVAVAVDATGYAPLGECVVSQLEHLRAPVSPASHKSRFTVFFERR